MPITIHVFARRERMPSAAQWAQAMREHGFAADFGTSFDAASFSGYLPCPDELTGFELYVEPFSAASIEVRAATPALVGDADTMATFRLSGRESDLAAATQAAATLAAITGGVLFDEQSGHFVASTQALAWARDEAYVPLAVHRARARRHRARFRLATLVRLAILLAICASILFFWR